uniref:RNA-directed RNA polymerase L n=1 Tax=Shenzhen bunya-like virus 2 TaxID=2789622 RepID=A0A7T1GW09_9VIRU|nr:polyprotein [Shenzhen bunya-like virus 2]
MNEDLLRTFFTSQLELAAIGSVNVPLPFRFYATEFPDISGHCILNKATTEFVVDTGQSRFIRNLTHISNIRHDFTYAFLTNETDQPLSTILNIPDGTNNLTPDWIIKVDEKHFHVIEFTTCAIDKDTVVTNAFNSKLIKYIDALKTRAHRGLSISFYIIVTTPNSVLSNVDLGNNIAIVNYLCSRYRKTDSMAAQLLAAGYDIHSPDQSVVFKKIKNVMATFNLDPLQHESRTFTQTLWENKDKDFSEHYPRIKEIISEEFLNAYNSFPPNPRTKGEFTREERKAWFECWKHQTADNTRLDQKHVCNVPYLNAFRDQPKWLGTNIKQDMFDGFKSDNSPEGELIASVVANVLNGDFFYEENVEGERQIALHLKPPPDKERRGEQFKTHVSLNEETEIELAKKGWNGKKHFREKDVIAYKLEKKKPFSIHTDVKDIEQFIERDDLYKTFDDKYVDIRDLLLKDSHRIHGDKKQWIFNEYVEPSIKMMKQSGFYNAMSIITQISAELSLCYNKHVKHDEVLLKRLRGLPIFLIIKTSHSKGPMGFVVFCPANSVELPLEDSRVFRSMYRCGQWYRSDFVSCNKSKLENWVKAAPMFISIMSFAADYWQIGLPFSTADNSFKKVAKLTNFLMMVFIHDKKTTEEVMSLFRYIGLDGLKCFPEEVKPYTLYESFNQYPHNRLLIWVMVKLRNEVKRMLLLGRHRISLLGYHPEAFCCPYTNLILPSADHYIQTFYYGYLCNKEENPEDNARTKMYTKILTEEDFLRKNADGSIDRSYMGWKEPPDPRNLMKHEFSLAYLALACDNAKAIIAKNYGTTDIMPVLDEKILEHLSHEYIEDLSTLKASSLFGPDKYIHNFSTYHRTKACLALAPLIKPDTVHTVDLMLEVKKHFEDNGKTMHVCLFPKPQHTGLREIYVLDIYGRIFQRLLEAIAVVLAREFPSDTLSHPDNKYRLVDQQRKIIKESTPDNHKVLESSDNNDASKWSQTMSAPKLFSMLARLTPARYHGFLFFGFSLWEKKRIMIDVNILNHFKSILESNQEFQAYDNSIQRVYDVYSGKSSEMWMPGGAKSTYVEIQTGMMQGILHQNSSVLHTISLLLFKSFALNYLKTQNYTMGKPFNFHILHMQSSDDSAMTIAGTYAEASLACHYEFYFYTAVVFKTLGVVSKWLGIIPSVKKRKSNTANFMEFNSEFYFGQSVYKAKVKYVFSAIQNSESESLLGRMEESYNLITAIPENGGSFLNAAFVQYAAGLHHYQILGYSISPLFDEYAGNLLKSRDPSAGFFLLDFCAAPGLGGMQYLIYLACENTPALQAKLKLLLDNFEIPPNLTEEEKARRKTNAEILAGALNFRATSIPLSNSKKWSKAVAQLNTCSKVPWRQHANDDPAILYSRPSDGQETITRMLAKMHSKGVSSSFGSTNDTTRVINMGVYILSRDVLQIRELEEPNSLTASYTTKSLLMWSMQDWGPGELTTDQKKLFLPFIDEYESFQDKMAAFDEGSGHLFKMQERRRRVRSIITIYTMPYDVYSTPGRIVSDYWFRTTHSKLSRSTIGYHFRELQKKIAWLKDDPHETLEASPFEDHVQLRNYFNSFATVRRSVRLNGTPAKVIFGQANLVSAIAQDMWSGHRFLGTADLQAKSLSSQLSQGVTTLYNFITYPCEHFQPLSFNRLIQNCIPDLTPAPRSNRAALMILKSIAMNAPKQQIYEKIVNYQMGTIGYWSQKQTRQNYVYLGPGTWIGIINGINVRLLLYGRTKPMLLAALVDRDLTPEQQNSLQKGLIEWCDLEKVSYKWHDEQPYDDDLDRIPSANIRKLCSITDQFGLCDPVWLDDTRHPVVWYYRPKIAFQYENIQRFFIEPTNNVLRIMVHIESRDEPVQVLRIPIKPSIDHGVNNEAINTLNLRKAHDAWLRSKSLQLTDAIQLVMRLIKLYGYKSEHKVPTSFRVLLQKCLTDISIDISNVVEKELLANEADLVPYDEYQQMLLQFEPPQSPDGLFKEMDETHDRAFSTAPVPSDDFDFLSGPLLVKDLELFTTVPELPNRMWTLHPLFAELKQYFSDVRDKIKMLIDNNCVLEQDTSLFWFKIVCFTFKIEPSSVSRISEIDMLGYEVDDNLY